MIICSALYYPGWLKDLSTLVRDNRFYPGKAADTFPVWWAYLRKHYPDVHVVLYADRSSPVPIQPLLDRWMTEPYDVGSVECSSTFSTDEDSPLVHVKWIDQFAGQYFRPMQRNLVEAIITAYCVGSHLVGEDGPCGDDLFWLDADAFINTDIRPLVAGYDAAAPQLAHHQMTMDSVCTYISAARLHALDGLGIDLPAFLRAMLEGGPTETRMHTLQEGGLYKLFAYGKTRQLGPDIQLTHLSCYQRFMAFIERNPLDTDAYRELRWMLASLDRERLKGVELSFHDMDWPANATRREAQ